MINRFQKKIIYVKSEPQEETKDLIKEAEENLAKYKAFCKEKQLTFLTRFIEEKCKYDYQALTKIDDVKKAYQEYVNGNKEALAKYNVSYSLNLYLISKIDPRYEIKNITLCKFCKKKQFKNCCPEYTTRINRTKNLYFVNMALDA